MTGLHHCTFQWVGNNYQQVNFFSPKFTVYGRSFWVFCPFYNAEYATLHHNVMPDQNTTFAFCETFWKTLQILDLVTTLNLAQRHWRMTTKPSSEVTFACASIVRTFIYNAMFLNRLFLFVFCEWLNQNAVLTLVLKCSFKFT